MTFFFKPCLEDHVDKRHSKNVSLHENLKIYKCNVCDVSFSVRHSLKRHENGVHQGNEYSITGFEP